MSDIKRICPECGAAMSLIDYVDYTVDTGGLDAWWVCDDHPEHCIDHYGGEPLPPLVDAD